MYKTIELMFDICVLHIKAFVRNLMLFASLFDRKMFSNIEAKIFTN